MSSAPLIIHHANCPDGYGAAWWLGRHLGDHVKHAASYGEPPPWDLVDADTDVYIVDFCYPRDALWEIAGRCRKMTVLDHHQTAADDILLDGFHGTNAQTAALTHDDIASAVVIDQSRSGVGLVSDYVLARWGQVAPEFLSNIEDRDLWKFDLPETPAVFAAVTARPYTVEAWDDLADVYYWDLVKEGEAISMYRERLVEQICASTFVITLDAPPLENPPMKWDGTPAYTGGGPIAVRCASSPYAVGSDVAGRITEEPVPHPSFPRGIGAYCILHQDHVQVGLRSRGDGPDVAAIAEGYGGGGHRHASGFRVDWDTWERMTGG